jgi:hypothetical protein
MLAAEGAPRPAFSERLMEVHRALRRVALRLPAPRPLPKLASLPRLPGLKDVSWALGLLVGVQVMLLLNVPGLTQLLRRRFPRVFVALLK